MTRGGKRTGAGRPIGAITKNKPLTDKIKCFYRMVTENEYKVLDTFLKNLRA